MRPPPEWLPRPLVLAAAVAFAGAVHGLWWHSLPAADPGTRPVMVGAVPDLDACGTVGEVANMKPVPGNFLAVRAGPGTDFAIVDKLSPGVLLSLCEWVDGWWGIVHGPAEDDCGLSDSLPGPRPYSGPCRSGWVTDAFIRIVAD